MNDTQILNEVVEMLATNTEVSWSVSEISPEKEFENIVDFIKKSRSQQGKPTSQQEKNDKFFFRN